MVLAFFIAWFGFRPNVDLRTQEPKHHSAELENLAENHDFAVLTAGVILPAEQQLPLTIPWQQVVARKLQQLFSPWLTAIIIIPFDIYKRANYSDV